MGQAQRRIRGRLSLERCVCTFLHPCSTLLHSCSFMLDKEALDSRGREKSGWLAMNYSTVPLRLFMDSGPRLRNAAKDMFYGTKLQSDADNTAQRFLEPTYLVPGTKLSEAWASIGKQCENDLRGGHVLLADLQTIWFCIRSRALLCRSWICGNSSCRW